MIIVLCDNPQKIDAVYNFYNEVNFSLSCKSNALEFIYYHLPKFFDSKFGTKSLDAEIVI